jgi:hypothetical protein
VVGIGAGVVIWSYQTSGPWSYDTPDHSWHWELRVALCFAFAIGLTGFAAILRAHRWILPAAVGGLLGSLLPFIVFLVMLFGSGGAGE